MPTASLIQVKNLEAKYGQKTVLSDISFAVNPGEIFMVIGGSGCGKTTLLNNIIGLQEPSRGQVIIDGQDFYQANEKERLLILRKIGILYQSGALFGSLDLISNVRLPLEELTSLSKDAIEEISYNKLKMVGLGDFRYYMPAEVSGGMQKRAALARAMALDPKILFLDEPSAGLDPIISGELDQLIANLAQTLGITFVIVTHELASIFNIAKRIIMLHKGKIIAEGEPQQLRQHHDPIVKRFLNRRHINP